MDRGPSKDALTEQMSVEIDIDTETKRMEALRRYQILDTPPDGNFDGITSLAAKLLKVPIALTTLVDTDRIWFKSRHGLKVEQIGRDPGLCASAILHGTPYVVENAEFDPRSLANPLVAGEFGLRFYAAVPLTTHDNYRLGTLCVLDTEPREIRTEDLEILTLLAGLVMDQMELRLASRAIAEKNAELAELNEEKNGFLAMAAHDLRNPLTTVMLLANLLDEQEVGPLNEAQAEMVSSVCDSSQVMLGLVNDYLEFSAVGLRQIHLEKSSTCLASLVDTCVKSQQAQAMQKGIRIEFEPPSQLSEISLDPARIRQALGNLIGNAIKFSPSGSLISVIVRSEGILAVIEVSDEGPGIPPGEYEFLFKPFSATSVQPTGGEKSTGLGLSIAKRLVESHAGEIGVRSVVGKGSTFFIKLPQNGVGSRS